MDLAGPPVRKAATLILVRDPGGDACILVGRRSETAAFMPGAYVFPGGAVDPSDENAVPDLPLNPRCASRLGASAQAIAALRELREETGLMLGVGLDLSSLRYVFRAVTPPGYARRFDTWFFVADAAAVTGDPDHFAPEEPELSDLRWVAVRDVASFQFAPITRHVLSGVISRLPSLEPPSIVPEVGL